MLAFFFLCASAAAAAAAVTLSFDPVAPSPLHTVAATYVSFNIDTGSLYSGFDFTDPVLIKLASYLGETPTQLRIGGGAADNTVFTGQDGPRANCSGFAPNVDICVNAAYWDDIMAFMQRTGFGLVWDLNAAVRPATCPGHPAGQVCPWNATNAEALLDYVAESAARGGGLPVAFQLGNEMEDWYKRNPPLNISGAALAADYHTLRALLHDKFPAAAPQIFGPDACCEDRRPILHDFALAVPGALDALTVHMYPIPRAANNSCLPAQFTNKTAMASILTAVGQYQVLGGPLLAAGVPLIIGETATSAHGGCANLSHVFVSGFTYMYELGWAGQLGVVQVNRQDLAGFSSEGEPSHYMLLGPPGWFAGPLGNPHPDYWTALLWKSLVDRRVLASNFSTGAGSPGLVDVVDLHVWCSAEYRLSGGVVVTYFSMANESLTLSLPPGVASYPRTEYIMSSTAQGSSVATLYDDAIFLNGVELLSRPDGSLPVWPLPGRTVTVGEIALGAWTYGFIVLPTAAVPACTSAA